MKNENSTTIAIPRYQKISVEIAARIASGEYQEGEKIYARSSLASQYGVSAETARRAICVLCDLEIVASEKGSGVIILSQAKAAAFIRQYSKRNTLETIKDNLFKSIDKHKQNMENLNSCLSDLIAASEHFRSMNPFMPFEVRITSKCAYLSKTIAEIQFWQHTGATVLAVYRDGVTMKSPSPYITLLENDIYYFLSQDDSPQHVKDFLYPPQ